MTKLLCKPCAKALEAGGKTVKPAGGRCEKITCRKEKYARNMAHRTGTMEERVDKLEERLAETDRKLVEYGNRLEGVEETMEHRRIVYAGLREHERSQSEKKNRRQRRGLVIALVLAIVALIVAVHTAGTEREAETVQPAAAMTARVEADLLVTAPEESDPWAFVALYRAAEDPLEAAQIADALEAQGYFSAAVPLSWEYQDYMRTYCHLYGCPYPVALAVADWETSGQFNMDAVGPAGEVGIFQLNPGPDGVYHAELEKATGLDPTTPEGNIAGGCYLLGKYLAKYKNITMAAMAYNMGQAGARNAWNAGITSTAYTDAVLEALEQWECTVNAWAGE